MKLRNTTLLVVGVTILCLVLILYIISNFLFISNLSNIEDQNTYNDVGVVNDNILKELSILNTTSYKWGQMGYFSQPGVNESDVKQIISGSDVDFIMVLDSKNNLLYAKSYNSSTQTFSNISGDVQTYISNNPELLNRTDTNYNSEGVLLLNNQSILIASNKIKTINGSSNSNGTLILGMNLNSVDFNKITGNQNTSLSLVPFDNSKDLPIYEGINPGFSANSPIWVNNTINGVQGVSIFRNKQGVAVIEMDLKEAHNILNNAYMTLYYFIASFLLVGSILVLIILFYLDKMVLLRIKFLSDNVNKINPNIEKIKQLPVKGNDELTLLTTNINRMLNLITARTAELEDSYSSLKISNDYYTTLFNSIDEGFCTIEVIFDSNNKAIDYHILEMNPTFEKQIKLNETNDKVMIDVAQDNYENCFEFYGKIALTGKSKRFINEVKKLSKWYDVYAFKVGGPESREVGLLYNDITKFKITENKLKEYQHTLEEKVEKRTEELSRSNSELEHFAYVASHDLKEPLRMIKSFLQLLESRYTDQLDQDANEFIGFAVDGAKRLENMINDLLEYSKVKSKEIKFTTVNSEEILNEVLMNLKVSIEENNAIITHDPLPRINGDKKILVQLFQNLISNSIKYRSKEQPKIHVSANIEKNRYLFSIKDNGIGMSNEYLEKIFTIFKRLHTKDEYEGSGIGLAIVQKIVNLHGGKIWVESQIGKGTTFYFTIPKRSN